MKPFRYPLQSVLVLRQRQEHQSLEAYAQRLQAKQQAAQELEVATRRIADHAAHFRETLCRGCSAGEIARLRAYAIRLDEARQAANTSYLGAERAVALALREMLASRQRRETMDQHREQLRLNHQRGINAHEAKELDDLAGRGFRARQSAHLEHSTSHA